MLFITYPSNDTLAEDFLLSQLYQHNQGLTVSLDVIFERQTECTCDNCYNNLLMYFFSGAGERLTLELEKSVHLQIFLTDTLSVMIRHFTPSYLQPQAPVCICLSFGLASLFSNSDPSWCSWLSFSIKSQFICCFYFLWPNIELVLQFASSSLSML